MSIETITLNETLELETGAQLENPTVAYSVYGTLNEDKSNVILVCHALTANSEVSDWWKGIFGKGRILDPSENYIICINNLGSPYGTISPKSIQANGERYGLDFPEFTIKDTANLHLLLLKYFGLQELKLLIGGSCGGNIAQEIAVKLGDGVKKMVLLCCSATETPWVISIHESQRIVLKGDPEFSRKSNNPAPEGLRGARAFALPFYRSHPSFILRQSEDDPNKLGDFKASSYVRYQGQKFVDRYDAHCYFKQLNSLDTHNIRRGFANLEEALSNIKAKTLCIGFNTDILIPVIEQKTLAKYIPNATYTEIETLFGHDAFLIETDQIQAAFDKWNKSLC